MDLDEPIKDYSEDELDFLLYSPKIVLSNKDQGFVQSFSHEGIINRLVGRATDLRGVSGSKKKNEKKYWVKKSCSSCDGGRLNKKALGSEINGKNIGDYSCMSLTRLIEEIGKIGCSGSDELRKRIIESAGFLIDVDLGYLSLNRGLDGLSGGESQRLKLARELGSDLIEMVYVLDEPTAGLHPKDREKLIRILHKLRDSGNTVIIVEHNEAIMREADNIIEVGPGAGREGGKITFNGSFDEMKKSSCSVSGKYLGKSCGFKDEVRKPSGYLEILNATRNNLKGIDVKIPLGVFCSISGLSGSGKSSLIMEEFVEQFSGEDVVVVNQSSLMGSVRGNIATYSGVFGDIRKLFALENNVTDSLFSSNSKGGCPDCKGLGFNKIDMHFMGDVRVKCETCKGKKYTEEVLDYLYNGKNVDDVLSMTVNEASRFFEDDKIRGKLKVLIDVGLGYLTLGQTHDSFSGGEAQRLKLARELEKRGKIFVLDEPTSGLHFADVERLLVLLNRMVDAGNSVVVIEHDLNVIGQSDFVIDLGPEGGEKGGEIVAVGTPKEVARNKKSATGRMLG